MMPPPEIDLERLATKLFEYLGPSFVFAGYFPPALKQHPDAHRVIGHSQRNELRTIGIDAIPVIGDIISYGTNENYSIQSSEWKQKFSELAGDRDKVRGVVDVLRDIHLVSGQVRLNIDRYVIERTESLIYEGWGTFSRAQH